MTACSDDSNAENANENTSDNEDANQENADNQANAAEGEKEEVDTDIDPQNLLDWETEDFEASDHESITFDEYIWPEGSSRMFAAEGTLVLGGNDQNIFLDYPNGKRSDFELNDRGKAKQSNDQYHISHVFGNYFYTINYEDDNGREQLYIVEVNMETGKKKVLTKVDQVYDLAKSGDVLFVEEKDNFFAFDTKEEEKVWENELDKEYFNAHTTEDAVILLGEEYLTVFDQSDGEEINTHKAEGYFHTLGVDEDDLYIAEESQDTLTDIKESVIDVYRAGDGESEPEKLLITPAITTPDEDGELQIDVDGDSLYIKSIYGISAYDKNDGESLYHVTIGEDFVQEVDFETPSHDDFDTAYNNGSVFVRTTISEDSEDKTIFTVMDGRTGEITENYTLEGTGTAYGPVMDDDNALVIQLDETDDRSKMYIIANDDL